MNNLCSAATAYAVLPGWKVFPCRGKTPAVRWRDVATTNPEQIGQWFSAGGFNVAVATGNGLVVLDVDNHGADGKSTLKALETQYGPLPDTVQCLTGGGGTHYYFRCDDPTLTIGAGIAPGIDFRAGGGYVVAPPSIHPETGGLYEWAAGCSPSECQIAELPGWLHELMTKKKLQQNAPTTRFSMPEEVCEGARVSTAVQLGGSLIARGLTPEAAEAAIREENAVRFNPPLTDDELRQMVFPALHRPSWLANVTAPYDRALPIDPHLLEQVKQLDPASNARYTAGDIGSARLFIDTCGATVKYAHDRRRWFAFDGTRWGADGEAVARERLKALADVLLTYARDLPDEAIRTQYLKFAVKWQSQKTRETILKDAQSVDPISGGDFDRDPMKFNCKNGVLNLRDFSFSAHAPQQMLSKMAGVSYDPSATCPRWEQFIAEVTDGDSDLAQYLQKCLGYALTGETNLECFFILFGATSRNGKSTLLETFAQLMGDYSVSVRPETLAKRQFANGSAPSEDVARLAGARFAVAAEPPRNMEMDAARVKALVGGDTITARRLHEGSFEFRPAFKLFVNCNHLPRVDDQTIFMSDRVIVLPFNVHFSSEQRDPNLKAELTADATLSGLLNWALDGLKALRREKLIPPKAVNEAVDAYRLHEDKLAQFLDERAEVGKDYEIPILELHSAFSTWCNTSGLMPWGLKKFREALEEKQIYIKKKRPKGQGKKSNPQAMVLGLCLKQEA